MTMRSLSLELIVSFRSMAQPQYLCIWAPRRDALGLAERPPPLPAPLEFLVVVVLVGELVVLRGPVEAATFCCSYQKRTGVRSKGGKNRLKNRLRIRLRLNFDSMTFYDMTTTYFWTFSSIGHLKLILRRILRRIFKRFFPPLDPTPGEYGDWFLR